VVVVSVRSSTLLSYGRRYIFPPSLPPSLPPYLISSHVSRDQDAGEVRTIKADAKGAQDRIEVLNGGGSDDHGA